MVQDGSGYGAQSIHDPFQPWPWNHKSFFVPVHKMSHESGHGSSERCFVGQGGRVQGGIGFGGALLFVFVLLLALLGLM